MFIDYYDNPEFAAALLDKMLEIRCFQAGYYAEVGVDILHTGDDLGMQHTLILSVPMWRKWIKPRLAQVIQTARRIKPDLIVEYHTDGFVEPFIPELIEIGIDVLNPVQPECMDPAEIKRKFGDRTLCGGEVQALLRAAVETRETKSQCNTISYRYSKKPKERKNWTKQISLLSLIMKLMM